MIRLPAPVSPGAAGAPDQRHLLFLTELARLIPLTDPSADVVRIELTDRPDAFASVSAWRAGPAPPPFPHRTRSSHPRHRSLGRRGTHRADGPAGRVRLGE